MLACDSFGHARVLIRLPRGCTFKVTGLEAMAEGVGISLEKQWWRLCFGVGAKKQRPALEEAAFAVWYLLVGAFAMQSLGRTVPKIDRTNVSNIYVLDDRPVALASFVPSILSNTRASSGSTNKVQWFACYSRTWP
jgi:hypothetical protein